MVKKFHIHSANGFPSVTFRSSLRSFIARLVPSVNLLYPSPFSYFVFRILFSSLLDCLCRQMSFIKQYLWENHKKVLMMNSIKLCIKLHKYIHIYVCRLLPMSVHTSMYVCICMCVSVHVKAFKDCNSSNTTYMHTVLIFICIYAHMCLHKQQTYTCKHMFTLHINFSLGMGN